MDACHLAANANEDVQAVRLTVSSTLPAGHASVLAQVVQVCSGMQPTLAVDTWSRLRMTLPFW